MLPKEKIDRINILARKKKTSCLTEAERIEQEELRKEYLISFRKSFIAQLEQIEIIDDNDVEN